MLALSLKMMGEMSGTRLKKTEEIIIAEAGKSTKSAAWRRNQTFGTSLFGERTSARIQMIHLSG